MLINARDEFLIVATHETLLAAAATGSWSDYTESDHDLILDTAVAE
jgi:hypothetical protein